MGGVHAPRSKGRTGRLLKVGKRRDLGLYSFLRLFKTGCQRTSHCVRAGNALPTRSQGHTRQSEGCAYPSWVRIVGLLSAARGSRTTTFGHGFPVKGSNVCPSPHFACAPRDTSARRARERQELNNMVALRRAPCQLLGPERWQRGVLECFCEMRVCPVGKNEINFPNSSKRKRVWHFFLI